MIDQIKIFKNGMKYIWIKLKWHFSINQAISVIFKK